MKRCHAGVLTLLLGIFFGLSANAAISFQISPYLYSILGQKIGVSWQYATNSTPSKNPTLSLFQNGRLTQTISSTNDAGLYSVVLPLPVCGFGADITYQVPGQSVPVSIAEIPCADSAQTANFSFLADAQEGVSDDKKFAELMAMFPGVGILNGGDLVQNGDSESDWEGYFSSMQSVGGSRILYPALGNHEYRDSDNLAPLWEHFFQTEAHDVHYAFNIGAARIIVINSNFESDPSLINGQLAWLEAELQIPSQWKIVFFHHPGYSVGFFNSPLAPKKEYVSVQDYYIPLFEKYGVDLVLNGHTHIFETDVKAGIHYLIVGPAGGEFGVYGATDPYKVKSDVTRSIINLDVAPNHLHALSIGIDGQTLDDLMLTK